MISDPEISMAKLNDAIETAVEFFESINSSIHDVRKYDEHSQPAHNTVDAVKDLVKRFTELERRLKAAKTLNTTLESEMIQLRGQYDQLRLKLKKESA